MEKLRKTSTVLIEIFILIIVFFFCVFFFNDRKSASKIYPVDRWKTYQSILNIFSYVFKIEDKKKIVSLSIVFLRKASERNVTCKTSRLRGAQVFRSNYASFLIMVIKFYVLYSTIFTYQEQDSISSSSTFSFSFCFFFFLFFFHIFKSKQIQNRSTFDVNVSLHLARIFPTPALLPIGGKGFSKVFASEKQKQRNRMRRKCSPIDLPVGGDNGRGLSSF